MAEEFKDSPRPRDNKPHRFADFVGRWQSFIMILLTASGWCIVFYMNATYLPRVEYKADQERQLIWQKEVSMSLVRLEQKMEHDVRQDATLKDHEDRIRDLERARRNQP